jgi:hypothetical protein
MQWFRWYHGTVTDPKLGGVARMAGQQKPVVIAVWAMVLESASGSDNRGSFDIHPADIADTLGIDTEAVAAVLGAMAERGMLSGSAVTAFEKRQNPSDDSKDRVRRYRDKRKQEHNDNVTSCNGDVTAPDLDTDTDSERDRKKEEGDAPSAPAPPSALRADVDQAVSGWNALAQELRLPAVQKLTKARRASLIARLHDCGGLCGWEAALARIRGSPFLRGENDREWRIDFDFLISERNFTKLMEGKYDNRGGRARRPFSAGENALLGLGVFATPGGDGMEDPGGMGMPEAHRGDYRRH